MSCTAVFRWYSDFRHGRVSTADMPRPGQPHVVFTQESIAAVNSLARENRLITTREIAESLFVSKRTVDTTLHEHLQYSKVCAQWVQKYLTDDQNCLRIGVCFQHLLRYRTDGNNFLPGLWLATISGAISSFRQRNKWLWNGDIPALLASPPKKNSCFNSSRESDVHVFVCFFFY